MPNTESRYAFHYPSAFTSSFLRNISFSRAFPQKAVVKSVVCRIHTLPLSFLMPLSKCYCNYRMGIQDFRPIYSSVFTRFWWRRHESRSPESEVCTATSSLASLFSLPLSLWDDLQNRSALCQNFNFYSTRYIAFRLSHSSLGVRHMKIGLRCVRISTSILHITFQLPHSTQWA